MKSIVYKLMFKPKVKVLGKGLAPWSTPKMVELLPILASGLYPK